MILPAVQFILATVSFVGQGGFGGGDGRLDLVIGLCSLPGSWAYDLVPKLSEFIKTDFMLMIGLPSIVNAGFWSVIGGMTYLARKRYQEGP